MCAAAIMGRADYERLFVAMPVHAARVDQALVS
jgi:hypothetical protein